MTPLLHTKAQAAKREFYCPQCGHDTPELHEGYCRECCDDRQRALDEHNASFDAWERLTDRERYEKIREAYR